MTGTSFDRATSAIRVQSAGFLYLQHPRRTHYLPAIVTPSQSLPNSSPERHCCTGVTETYHCLFVKDKDGIVTCAFAGRFTLLSTLISTLRRMQLPDEAFASRGSSGGLKHQMAQLSRALSCGAPLLGSAAVHYDGSSTGVLQQRDHLLHIDLGGRGARAHFHRERQLDALRDAGHQPRQLPRVAQQCRPQSTLCRLCKQQGVALSMPARLFIRGKHADYVGTHGPTYSSSL